MVEEQLAILAPSLAHCVRRAVGNQQREIPGLLFSQEARLGIEAIVEIKTVVCDYGSCGLVDFEHRPSELRDSDRKISGCLSVSIAPHAPVTYVPSFFYRYIGPISILTDDQNATSNTSTTTRALRPLHTCHHAFLNTGCKLCICSDSVSDNPSSSYTPDIQSDSANTTVPTYTTPLSQAARGPQDPATSPVSVAIEVITTHVDLPT
tara:strand:- start:3348 stop:3968 length:621 start_codon:yes stop_codon:yes gene_type:complete